MSEPPTNLLVFAHTPPPHHGQSYMVKLMLEGFGGDHRGRAQTPQPTQTSEGDLGIRCFHVNARLSRDLEDIGELRGGKLFFLLRYCLEAIWCRFRYQAKILYYVPSPGKRSALYRDWVVMSLCRPFFDHVVLHWHAAGMAKWLETHVQMPIRGLAFKFLGGVDLSIVLSNYNRADAAKLLPKAIRVVGNGIPDPCPDFHSTILPVREARLAARQALLQGEEHPGAKQAGVEDDPHVVRVLYLAHCTRDKGLFDAIEGVRLANRRLQERQPSLRLELSIAGGFVDESEKQEFEELMKDPEIARVVHPLGFVSGQEKARALTEADLFCFPTYFANENQPVNLVEAIAYGLPVVTTRWRSVAEILPHDYMHLVTPQRPAEVADALIGVLDKNESRSLRLHFEQHYTLEQHLKNLAGAIRSVQEVETKRRHSRAPA